jgi:tRNA pseudouridine55 synthase
MNKNAFIQSGIFLLDKPYGMTSNAALQQVKRLLRVKKAGHTGSLDPLATGMLPLCLDKATKLSSWLLNADKEYEVHAQLGVCTATGDAEGEVTQRYDIRAYTQDEIFAVLQTFRGEIEQIPPMFSALKQNGKPLYELARQGITVERSKRKVRIDRLNLIDRSEDKLLLEVACSKGTYIRTLIEDIGRALGCGAHVSVLRRTKVGSYQPEQMVTLEQLEKLHAASDMEEMRRLVLPIESCLAHLPEVKLNANLLFYVQRGQPVRIKGVPKQGWVRLFMPDGALLGVGEALEDGRIAPRRLLV